MTTLFARVGKAFYGESFSRPLSEALGIDQRTVQRWAAGSDRMTPPPVGVWRKLEAMVRKKNRESFELLEEIRKISIDQATGENR